MTPQLHYYDIAEGVRAFSSTRHGGASTGSHAEFNINAYCGDKSENVSRNRQLLCQCIGIGEEHIVMPHQTHGIESRIIAEDFFTLPGNVRAMVLEGVDCVMTRLRGTCIGVSTADCIPVVLYDTEKHAAAAVHAGWRGTVAKITMKAVNDMRMAFGTNPQNLRAVIGPGISKEAFEVGDEVYEQFAAAQFDMDTISSRMPAADGSPAMKWHIDLWECNRQQLLSTGVPADGISVAGICTYNNTNDWFSARRLGTESGRIFTGIIID